MSSSAVLPLVLIVFIGVLFALVLRRFHTLWLRAFLSGAHVPMISLVGMVLRRVRPETIVTNYIMATKAGLDLTTDVLETHYLAGGDVLRVVQALIAASKANIPLTFAEAAALDLAGRDVLAEVQQGAVWAPRTDATDGALPVLEVSNGLDVVPGAFLEVLDVHEKRVIVEVILPPEQEGVV